MKKRKSLFFKLIITMTCIVAGTILFSWFLNNTFLEKIYVYDRQKQIVSAYELVSGAYVEGTLADNNFLLQFQKLYNTNNLDVIVTHNSTVVLSTARDRSQIITQYNEIVAGIRDGLYSNGLKEKENYVITRAQDSSLKEEYLILYGTAGSYGEIFMRTPIKTMKESADITSMFLAITGVVALFISVIVILVMSRNITKPIRELSEISRKMAGLHFESKYVTRKSSSREIDELGKDINELSGTLEKTISELKSANNELLRDIKQKEEIDEMRKEFLSNVSHELKTPLAIISGYAEGLKDCVNDDEESRDYYCEVIMDESEKMNRMVQKLLSLNNLEFGNESLEMQRFDLKELVTGVILSFKVLLEKNEITVKHEGNESVYVWGDPFLIEQVVTNYISNAINHAKGEKEILIAYDEFDSKIRMTVYNTGDNIPAADIPKIWDKFYKVDKARTREYGGSGIGLSIVKAIADLHNEQCGVINCDMGVKFWIDFDTNC